MADAYTLGAISLVFNVTFPKEWCGLQGKILHFSRPDLICLDTMKSVLQGCGGNKRDEYQAHIAGCSVEENS